MRRSTKVLLNSLLLVVTTAMMLFVADMTLKILEIPIKYRAVQLLSGSKLFTDEFGVRRYEPNKDVEQAAYINGDLAFRYKYRTNNLGLVSKYDHDPRKPLDLMVVGDSVTEGQEVGPWFSVIQERLWESNGKTSQNFAIAGNGFVEFERAAAFAKKELHARKAMIVFIGGDMFRPGDFVQANEQCSTYRTLINSDAINCLSGNSTWFTYDEKLSDDELVSFAKKWQQFGLIKAVRKPVLSMAFAVATQACRLGITFDSDGAMARRYQYHCKVTKDDDDLRASYSAVPTVASTAPTVASTAPTVASTAPTSADLIPAYTIDALEKILSLYGPKNVLLVGIPGGNHSIRRLQTEAIFRKAFDNKFKSPIQFVDMSESCEMEGLWAPLPGTGPKRGWGHPTPEGYLKLQSCFIENKKTQEFAGS